MSEQIACQWTDDKLSIHREDDGEYLIVQLSEKWWSFLQQTHTLAIPLNKIEEVKQEHATIDALLRSALGD
jgi:hypothetical protein